VNIDAVDDLVHVLCMLSIAAVVKGILLTASGG
jgi:hypothetical protein